MSKINKNKWYELDNAAKLFPPTTTYYDPKIFRFSCLLKEEINVKNLKTALTKTLEDFPIFKSVLKKGFFWYYLETSDIKPTVTLETTSPCEKLNTPLLFEVTYFQNKINLEVYHALSDGGGCITFFKSLIYNYLKINYNLKDETVLTTSSEYELESDSFKKYYDPKAKIKLENKKNAYQIKGPWYPEGKLKIISGLTSTSQLKELAHKYNTTITGLLCALLIKSIHQTMNTKDKTKEISITLPIDLRKHFKSSTIRNFFNVTNINYLSKELDPPLEEIINSVNIALKNSLKPEIINIKMNRLIFLEKFFIIRLIPLFLKNIILKYSYNLTRKKQTLGLSNVGIITMPACCHKYINSFSVFNSTDVLELCICSYEDSINLSFSSHFQNSEIERVFFRLLKEYNLDLDIYTNTIKGCENNE